jgi:hypothetical protein
VVPGTTGECSSAVCVRLRVWTPKHGCCAFGLSEHLPHAFSSFSPPSVFPHGAGAGPQLSWDKPLPMPCPACPPCLQDLPAHNLNLSVLPAVRLATLSAEWLLHGAAGRGQDVKRENSSPGPVRAPTAWFMLSSCCHSRPSLSRSSQDRSCEGRGSPGNAKNRCQVSPHSCAISSFPPFCFWLSFLAF